MKYEEIKLEYSPEWKGPVKERTATDKHFLAIFAGVVICWIAIGCYAISAGNLSNVLDSENSENTEKAPNIFETASSTSATILGLIAAGAVVCLLYMFLLKWIVVPVVFTSIVASIVLCIYLSYYCYQRYATTNESTSLTACIIFAVKAVIILVVTVCHLEKMRIACQLIKEASKAVTTIASSLFFPMFPWLIQLGAALYLLIVGVYLCTIDSLGVWPFRILFAFHVIGYIWFHCFITAFAEMTLAGTFATWYWTFKKTDVPFFTVASCAWRTSRYHLGTVAFGALLITICRVIRYILESIRSSRINDPCCLAARIIVCCAAGLMTYLEKFVKFMNRNAYIISAIYGKGLCSSASDAMSLILRNVVQVIVLNNVVSWVLWIVKMSITLLMGTLAWSLYVSAKEEIDDWWVPILLVVAGTYTIATSFMSTYEIAVDTIFLCYLEDCERNDGSETRPYYMSRQLRKLLHKETATHFVPV